MYSLETEKKPELLRNLKKIREKLNVKAEIKSNTITFIAQDGLDLFKLQKVIDALNAGFSDSAFKLLEDDYDLIVIPIKRASKKDKERKRILSRIIGTKGKTKKNIAKLANVEVIIDDKKKEIFLLGKLDNLITARESINRLIEGQPHSKVYSFLESYRREEKFKRLI